MGKTRACAAAKKARIAAKSKNLEFLTENVKICQENAFEGGKKLHRKADKSVETEKLMKKNAADVNKGQPKSTVHQLPGTSKQTNSQKAGKALQSHPERREEASSPSLLTETNKSYSHTLNIRADDESQIDVEMNDNRQLVENVVMDILIDWAESDNDEIEPMKVPGKTYTRVRDETDKSTDFHMDESPRQETANAIVCVCGRQSRIDDLVKANSDQAAQILKLKRECEENKLRCLRLTDALNAKILGNPHEDIFTYIEGFATKERLKQFSEAGPNSDYIFIKLLMHELWPSGFANRSVTGRLSNNPRGRHGKDGTEATDTVVAASKIPLESEKVSYVEDRLVEHRLYQGDSGAVARAKSKECGRLMTRVIAYYGKKGESQTE